MKGAMAAIVPSGARGRKSGVATPVVPLSGGAPGAILGATMTRTQDPLPAATAPRAKTLAVTASAFLVAVATGSASLGLVFYVRELFGVPASTVGLLAATNSLCYVSGCLLLRPVFRRVRSRYCLLIATGGCASALAAILLVRGVAATFALYAVFGFLMAFFWPPLASWLSHGLESSSLGHATSRFNMSWSLGTIFSSYVAGRLSELDPAAPLVFSAALYAATFTLLIGLALLSPELRRDEHREAEPARGGATDQGTPLRFPAWMGLFAAWTVIGVIANVFPLYARESLGLAKSGIGTILLVRALFTTVAFLLLGRLTFWHFRGSAMAVGLLVFAGLVALFALARTPAAMGLLMCGIGPCGALAYSSALFHAMAGSSERARRMGIHEAVLSLGMVTGSTAGSFVYQEVSMAAAFGGGACLLALVACGQLAVTALLRRRGLLSASAGASGPRSP
jgi:MFS family permease